jgi:hypothetical protein
MYVAAMSWILVGARTQIRAGLPWFMQGWTSLNGLVSPPFVGWFAALALLFAVAWRLGPSRTPWALPFAAFLLATSTTALAIGGEYWCAPVRCEYVDMTSPHVPATLLDAWRFTAEHVRRSTIAYTGINLPYPLTGEQLTNRVVYVNTDGHPRWRFHDYDRAYRAGRFAPIPPALATGSGELLAIGERAGARDDAVRPRYERLQGRQAAWIGNLSLLKVDHLFISALSAYEIDYVWHNTRGFPVEDEWAAADPASFSLEYENQRVRMYAVNLRERAR